MFNQSILFQSLMFVHVLLLVTGIATPFTTSLGETAFYIARFAMGLAHNAYLMSFYMLGKFMLIRLMGLNANKHLY